MDIDLETLNTEVVLPGENILSTHAQSVRINYESHSVSKIYIFLHVAEENNSCQATLGTKDSVVQINCKQLT